jgi:hypothetical protein
MERKYKMVKTNIFKIKGFIKNFLLAILLAGTGIMANLDTAAAASCGGQDYNTKTSFCCDGGQEYRVCSLSEVCNSNAQGAAFCDPKCEAGYEPNWNGNNDECRACANTSYSDGNHTSCKNCPGFDSLATGTSTTHAYITSCFIPATQSFTDTLGAWKFQSNCSYTQ